MKKKILVVVLCMAMVFTATGCFGKRTTSTDNSYVAPNSQAATNNSKVKSKCTVL